MGDFMILATIGGVCFGLFMLVVWIVFPFSVSNRLDKIIKLLQEMK